MVHLKVGPCAFESGPWYIVKVGPVHLKVSSCESVKVKVSPWYIWRCVLVYLKVDIGTFEGVPWYIWRCAMVHLKVCRGTIEGVPWYIWRCAVVHLNVCHGTFEGGSGTFEGGQWYIWRWVWHIWGWAVVHLKVGLAHLKVFRGIFEGGSGTFEGVPWFTLVSFHSKSSIWFGRIRPLSLTCSRASRTDGRTPAAFSSSPFKVVIGNSPAMYIRLES